MTFNIKPQDKRLPEKAEFELHPDLIARLKAFAKSLDESDPSYVLGQILQQALPPEKAGKKERPEGEPKPKKASVQKAA
ncbi:MAG: hypothetical protein WB992_05690 [Bryobacteraceae bacterium]